MGSLLCCQCICLFCFVVNQYSPFPCLLLALLSVYLSFLFRCESVFTFSMFTPCIAVSVFVFFVPLRISIHLFHVYSLHCCQCICLFCSVVNQYSPFPCLPSPLALLSLSFFYRCKSS